MTYIVTQACMTEKNKACIDVCPVACIYTESDELDRMVYINADECIDCGACESACPVSAIFPEHDVPEELEEYIDINLQWFENRDAVRARVNALRAELDESAA